jgi:hypothetical protein
LALGAGGQGLAHILVVKLLDEAEVGRFTFDALDEVLLPEKGLYIGVHYEGSFAKLGSDVCGHAL